MTSMTKRNADSALNAKQLANQTRTSAEAGAADMTQMTTAMNDIKAASDNIAKIVKSIDEISTFPDQHPGLERRCTEAAQGRGGNGIRRRGRRGSQSCPAQRASGEGDHGKDRRSRSAKSQHGVQINGKVAESPGGNRHQGTALDEFDRGNRGGVPRAESRASPRSTSLSHKMDKVTQSNAAGAEESASAAEELNAQAIMQKTAVGELLALAGSKTAETPAPTSNHVKPKSKNGHSKSATPARLAFEARGTNGCRLPTGHALEGSAPVHRHWRI